MPNLITKRRIIFSGVKYSREAEEWFGVLSTQPSGVIKTIYDKYYFRPLVGTGIFAELDRFFEFGGEIEANGLISLKNPTTATAASKAGTSTWTQFQGNAGNGIDGFINTNYNPNTQGVKLTLNSTSIFGYSRSDMNDASALIACSDATHQLWLFPRSAGNIVLRVNSAGGSTSAAVADSHALFASVRLASNSVKGYKRGVEVATNTTVSAGIPSANLYVGALNNNGAGANFSTRQISTAGAGSGAINHLTLYTIIQAFRTQLQTQV